MELLVNMFSSVFGAIINIGVNILGFKGAIVFFAFLTVALCIKGIRELSTF